MNREPMPVTDEERKIDDTVEDSFPASDPPSNTPETGVQPRKPKSREVDDNARRPTDEPTH